MAVNDIAEKCHKEHDPPLDSMSSVEKLHLIMVRKETLLVPPENHHQSCNIHLVHSSRTSLRQNMMMHKCFSFSSTFGKNIFDGHIFIWEWLSRFTNK